MNTKTLLSMLAPLVLAAGCATEPPLAKGDAVRAMVRDQTFDPAATQANGVKAPEGTDSLRADAAVRAMREGVAKPKEDWQMGISSGAVRVEE
jgi:hypothetical protein